jgi:D-alanyl-D-alanine carboxypeptidase/D-alanyl-D-alanine-endopeptidase (penicillin-binding protein 4)
LLVETNQESNNLYAEVLLRSLGTGASRDSTELGLKKLKETLTALGVTLKAIAWRMVRGYRVKT